MKRPPFECEARSWGLSVEQTGRGLCFHGMGLLMEEEGYQETS